MLVRSCGRTLVVEVGPVFKNKSFATSDRRASFLLVSSSCTLVVGLLVFVRGVISLLISISRVARLALSGKLTLIVDFFVKSFLMPKDARLVLKPFFDKIALANVCFYY